MRKRSEVAKRKTERRGRKSVTAELSIERIKKLGMQHGGPLKAMNSPAQAPTQSKRAEITREESVKRLNHLEEYMDAWIQEHRKELTKAAR